MAEIYIYRPDCDDFSTIGECGRLTPSRYEWDGAVNSLPELIMEHPIDPAGRYLLLREDWILKGPAPVRTMPEIVDGAYVTTVERWTVADTATKAQRYIYTKRSGGKKKKLLKAGTEVIVTSVPATGERWKVKTGKASGWMASAALTGRTEVTIPDDAMGMDQAAPAWQTRDQLFRIYGVNSTEKKITVYARGIAGDAMGNLTTYDINTAVDLQTAADGIIENTLDECRLEVQTDIAGERTGVHACDMNPVAAILNPEGGIAARWNAQVVFDDDDVYLLAHAGADRGVRIEYAKNLNGIDMDVSVDEVATHVRPIGEQKNGKPLYLATNSGLVACPRAEEYPFMRIRTLEVSEAKVSSSVSTAVARRRLQAAADELIETGIDEPVVSVKADFRRMGDTARYRQYRDLQSVFLYDKITVWHPVLGVDMKTSVCRVKWDGLRDQIIETELGKLEELTPTVAPWQINGKINGQMILVGTLSSLQLADGSIAVEKMDQDVADDIAAGAAAGETAQAAQETAEQAQEAATEAQQAAYQAQADVNSVIDKQPEGIYIADQNQAITTRVLVAPEGFYVIDPDGTIAASLLARLQTLGTLKIRQTADGGHAFYNTLQEG